MSNNSPLGKAFTFAEVLITLGIIGVVAALTLPTLIANSQKAQYVTSLKKFYTTFNQALLQITNDYGCNNDLVCTELFDTTTTSDTLGAVFTKYIKTSKICDSTSTENCWTDKMYTYFDGSHLTAYISPNTTLKSAGYFQFITADGMSVMINNLHNNCLTNYSISGTGSSSKVCGIAIVDVNGFKTPNVMGRDIFWFDITNGKGAILYPEGGSDYARSGVSNWWQDPSNGYCYAGVISGSRAYMGPFCAARIIEEGWQMNY